MNWTLWGFHLHLNTFIFKNEERCVSLHFRPVILNYGYTRNRNVLTMWFLAGNQGNHQNFDPSLLANNLWRFFMRIKQKKFLFSKKKFQNGRLKKSAFFKIANSQCFFVKISWIGPWVSRIDWCEGHWFISTYMAVRLSDIRAKTGKKCNICVFRLFLPLCQTASQPYV